MSLAGTCESSPSARTLVLDRSPQKVAANSAFEPWHYSHAGAQTFWLCQKAVRPGHASNSALLRWTLPRAARRHGCLIPCRSSCSASSGLGDRAQHDPLKPDQLYFFIRLANGFEFRHLQQLHQSPCGDYTVHSGICAHLVNFALISGKT